MRFLSEFRDPQLVSHLVEQIQGMAGPSRCIMEVCGGQTHSIVRYGLDTLVQGKAELIHGPGCPVCVTPLEMIDRALAIARRPEVVFCSFGDMLRVPGSGEDLLSARADGADVRIVYSPMDAVSLAKQTPERQIVFFGIGFETTAPATAMAISQAHRLGLNNFSMLVSHVRVPPALEAIMSHPENRVEGFLAAGHVCAVMGYREYEPLIHRYGVPIVVTGFEPIDILQGILQCLKRLATGNPELVNAYPRIVSRDGNTGARQRMETVFSAVDHKWRGIGEIPESGLALRKAYQKYDAALRFDVDHLTKPEPEECRSGSVLQGQLKPDQCPAFATRCTPEHPLGATMVSTEGACAAYYRYRRLEPKVEGDES